MKKYNVNVSGDITVEIQANTKGEASMIAHDILGANYDDKQLKHISQSDYDALCGISNWIVENIKENEVK
jgi:hypothetical protein